MSRFRSRLVARLGLPGLALVLCGCGGPKGTTVNGTVNLDEAPLDTGRVEFRTPDGAGIVAEATVHSGTYGVPGEAMLRPGTYRVTICSSRPTGRKIPAGSPFPPGTMVDEIVERIPVRYNEESVLEAVVNAGVNTIDFDLVTGSVSDRGPR
jgi:hypothetical protein